MSKIGYFSDQTIYGGGESNLVRLAKMMSAQHDVTVVAPEGRLLEKAVANGIRTISIPERRSRWVKGIPLSMPGARRLAGQFDVVHAYSLHVLPMLLGHPNLYWTTHGPWEKPWGLRGRIISAQARAVIAVSQDVRAHCKIGNDKLYTIPLGAINAADCATPLSGAKGLSSLETVSIGVLGRIQPIKGQDLAIDGISRLASAYPERRFRLRIGGIADPRNSVDVEFEKSLKHNANEATAQHRNLEITWHGFIQNPLRFLDEIDIALVPSRYESFGMVSVEALSRGKLVIAPNIGGCAEIIANDGLGLKFDSGSAESLFATLARAITSFTYSPEKLVQHSMKYTVEAQKDALLKLYGLS